MGIEYDELLIGILGEFGLYQKLIVVAASLISIVAAFNNMGIVFLAAEPDHRCHVPSTSHLQLSTDRLQLLTAPPGRHKCFTYNQNYTNWTVDDVEAVVNGTLRDNVTVTSCQYGWEYDKSIYQSTIVTDWDLVCDRKTLVPTVASIYMAGLMVGVLLFGFISDLLGRRVAFVVCSLMLVTFAIAFPFSPNYAVFAGLRFLLAMANMGLLTTAFVIVMEMVGPSYRVFAGVLGAYAWSSGYIIIAGIAYGLRDWKYLGLGLSVPQALVLILIFLIPESPRWLYSQNKHTRGDVIIEKMAKVNGVTLPDKVDVVLKTNPKAYLWDLFRYPKLRMRTLYLFFDWFVVSMVYYGLSLNTSKLGGNDYINFFIAGAVEFPAIFFTTLSMHYIGRRWTLAATFIGSGISLLCLLAVPKGLTMVATVLAMIGKFCITGAFSTIYIFSAELFPTVVRNIGVGSSSFCARIGGIIAPYIGSLIDVSVFIPYISFGVLSIVAGLVGLLLPETRGHQLPETIDDGERFPNHIQKEGIDGKVNLAYRDTSDVKMSTKC